MVNPDSKLHMKLSDSDFQFSKRMLNFFEKIGISTIAELATIPLSKLICFKGFKAVCKKELVAFIEFENIQSLFIEFNRWKNT